MLFCPVGKIAGVVGVPNTRNPPHSTLVQSLGVAQALEKTPAHVKAVDMRGTIGLQDPALRQVLATHRCTAHRFVELERCECQSYKLY